MTTPDVRVRLSAEGVAEVVSALKKVQSESAKTSQAGSRSFGLLNGALGSLKGWLVGLGSYLTVRSFAGFIRGGLDAAAAVNKLSVQLGTTVEYASSLAWVAARTGVDLQSMAMLAAQLAKRLDALERGGKPAIATFRRLGLAAKDFEGKDIAESLGLVAEAFVRVPKDHRLALAMELFGRRGAALIPVLNELGQRGFDETIRAARELGIVLDADTARAASAANKELRTLQFQAKMLGAQFVGGMAPQLKQTFAIVSGELGKSGREFQRWGDVAGQAVNGVLLLVTTLLDLLKVDLKIIAGSIASTAIGITGLIRAGSALLKGHTGQAEAELEAAKDAIIGTWESTWDSVSEGAKRFVGRVNALAEGPAKAEAEREEPEIELPEGIDPELRLELARAALEREAALFRAQAKLRNEQDKQAWEQGLLSVQEYFAKRRRAATEATDAEIAALLKERALLETEPDDKRAQGEQKIDSQIARLREELSLELLQLTGEERKAIEDLGDKREAIERRLLEAQGRRHEAALEQIEKEAREYDELLAKQGVAPEERTARVAEFRQTYTAVADFDEAERQAQAALDQVDLARQEIQRKVDQGLISEIRGQREIAELELQRLPVLRELADALLAAAEASGDPARVLQAQQFVASLEELGQLTGQVNELANAIDSLNANIEGSAVDSLADALAGIGRESKNARQALAAFAASFAQAVQQMISRLLALWAIKKLVGLFGEGGAVDAKSEGGEVETRASGGEVVGPGTGTSDSILAAGPRGLIRLSSGEYVVRAREVQRPGGLRFLHAYNAGRFDPRELLRTIDPKAFARGGIVERGMATPLVLTAAAFANGGAVTEPSAAPISRDSKMLIGLEEGLVLRSLDSPEGERLIVRTIARNRRALSRLWR